MSQQEKRGAHVLVVDDDPATRACMEYLCSHEGYAVTVAADGREALAAAARQTFQLAFLDLRLPDTDGTELIVPLREKCPDMGVVIFTGHASIESASDALKLGADSYILKPIRRLQVLEEARRVLEKRHLARENRRLLQATTDELTRRQRVESELRQVTDELQTILDSDPAMIWFKDKQNNMIRSNRAAAESVGMEPEELAGMSCRDIFPEEAAHYYEDDLEVIHSGLPKHGIIEQMQVSPTEKRWLRTDKIPYRDREGRISGVIVFAVDITEAMEAEQAREAADANYRSLLQDSTDAILVITTDRRIVYKNPVAQQLLPDRDEVLVRRVTERRPGVTTALRLPLDSGQAVDFDVEITRTEWEGSPAELVTLRDITARVTAERKQRRTAQRLRILRSVDHAILLAQSLEAIADAVLQYLPRLVPCDWAGILEFTNELSATDHDRARLLGTHDLRGTIDLKTGAEFHTAVLRPACAVPAARRKPRVRRVPRTPRCDIETELSEAGLLFYAAISFVAEGELLGCLVVAGRRRSSFSREKLAILAELSEGVAVALKQARLDAAVREKTIKLQRTIEELQYTRQQLDREERLNSLGKMASGMVHEFNNSLSPILGFSDLIIKRPEILDDRPRLLRFLRNICTAAHDAASTVDQLREFYRPRRVEEERRPVDLQSMLSSAIALATAKLAADETNSRKRHDVQTDFNAVGPVMGRETDLRQALINLIYNAAEAMPEGGTIRVSLREIDTNVAIEVSDSGVGMDEETRQRCLEPFFTTKRRTGSGLGLAMVYGIVRRHNGRIELTSRPQEGTTFTIFLPRTSTAIEEPFAVTEITVLDRLRILIIEPDDGVRGMLMEYTAQDGHTVSTAVRAKEGLVRFEQSRFDLVMLTAEVDDIGLERTVATLKKKCPTVPIVLLSASSDLSKSPVTPKQVDVVLRKPLTLADFRRAVKQALEGSPHMGSD